MVQSFAEMLGDPDKGLALREDLSKSYGVSPNLGRKIWGGFDAVIWWIAGHRLTNVLWTVISAAQDCS